VRKLQREQVSAGRGWQSEECLPRALCKPLQASQGVVEVEVFLELSFASSPSRRSSLTARRASIASPVLSASLAVSTVPRATRTEQVCCPLSSPPASPPLPADEPQPSLLQRDDASPTLVNDASTRSRPVRVGGAIPPPPVVSPGVFFEFLDSLRPRNPPYASISPHRVTLARPSLPQRI
jgi:hypothetical protein